MLHARFNPPCVLWHPWPSPSAASADWRSSRTLFWHVKLIARHRCSPPCRTAEEKDYKTAYSYFFEAFEQLSALDDSKAVVVLKYMLLCKVSVGKTGVAVKARFAFQLFIPAPVLQIMTGDVSDVPAIISSKGGLKYAGAEVDAMRAVARAHQDRSLQEFQATLQVRALGWCGRNSLCVV